MNIDRMNAGSSAHVQPRPGVSAGVDLTISDQGVTASRVAPAPVDAVPIPAQITSTAALQHELSADETRALAESFSAPRAAGTSVGTSVRTSVYNGRGARVDVQATSAHGRLVDITG